MKKLHSILLASALTGALLLSACGNTASSSQPAGSTSTAGSTASTGEAITITVGATPAPHAEILEQIKPILAEEGITLNIKEFTDYVLPNEAVSGGDIDANFFQHLPYLENFNKERGTDLVSAVGVHIEPMGVYAGKQDSLDNIPDGAKIAIPNDATNEGRALLLLEAQGLITLDKEAGVEATPLDITDNPHNIEFTEIEAAQLPNILPDVDYAVINGNFAISAGVNDKVIVAEGAESPYVNVLVVRSGDENRPEIQALVKALTSDTVRTFINETYGGEVVAVF